MHPHAQASIVPGEGGIGVPRRARRRAGGLHVWGSSHCILLHPDAIFTAKVNRIAASQRTAAAAAFRGLLRGLEARYCVGEQCAWRRRAGVRMCGFFAGVYE